jgi:hypothetical protein
MEAYEVSYESDVAGRHDGYRGPERIQSNLANSLFASSCDSRRPIISFGTCHLRGFNKQIFGADEQALKRWLRALSKNALLTREIKAAEIVRIPLSPTIAADAAELLRSGKADVFGADSGVGYPAAEALPGAKIVPGAFAMVRVAAALPKGRSAAAQAALATLVDKQNRAASCRRRSMRRASRA